MRLNNLKRYIPDELFNGDGIQYFIDENGKDWFKSLPKFTKKYALAIENDTGIIRSISEDASRLYPVGLTVVDVDTLPDGCDITGGWVFNGKKIVPRIYTEAEICEQVESRKVALQEMAEQVIAPLARAVKLNIATDEEIKRLEAWEVYSVKLSRVNPEDPVWPEMPDNVA